MPLPIAVGEVSVRQFGFVQFLDSAPGRFGQAGFISDRVEPGSNWQQQLTKARLVQLLRSA